MKIFKKVLLVSVLAAAVMAGSIAYMAGDEPKTWKDVLPKPEHTKVDESKPLREQTRTFEMAGRTFEIPIMYIDGRPEPGMHQDSMLLEVIWPEMKSIYELKDRAEYQRIRKEEHRLGWILLEPASIRSSLDIQVSNLRKFLAKEEYIGSIQGLEKYLWYNDSPNGPVLHTELYLEINSEGKIIGFNRCRVLNIEKMSRYPRCSHRFVDDGILYDVSYNKEKFFPQWLEQRQRAIDFLESFELNTVDINQSTGGQ